MSANPYQSPTEVERPDIPKQHLTRNGYTYRPANLLLAINGSQAMIVLFLSIALTIGSLVSIPLLSDLVNQTSYLFVGLVIASLAWNLIYLMATYRVVANSHVLAKEPPELSAGFAVGSYFIPIVNLIRPYQAIRECYSQCGVAGLTSLRVWWAAHLIGLFMKEASRRLMYLGRTENSESTLAMVDDFSFILNLVLPAEVLVLALFSHLALSRLAAMHARHLADAAQKGEWTYMSPWTGHVSSTWGAD